jgi:hypothetical protein
MPINLTGTRPVATKTEPLPVQLTVEPPVEDDALDQARLRVTDPSRTAPPFSLTAAVTNGTAIITAANLSKLRVRDAIASAEITGTVLSIDLTTTPHSATIDTNASATNAAAVLTVTPPQYDLAIYEVVSKHTLNGNILKVQIDIHRFDGSDSKDANGDGKDDAVASANTLVNAYAFNVDLDQFLTRVRIPQT